MRLAGRNLKGDLEYPKIGYDWAGATRIGPGLPDDASVPVVDLRAVRGAFGTGPCRAGPRQCCDPRQVPNVKGRRESSAARTTVPLGCARTPTPVHYVHSPRNVAASVLWSRAKLVTCPSSRSNCCRKVASRSERG